MSNPEAVPFETTLMVRDTCLCLHLQRAARAVARRFDAMLRPLGLTSGQFSLLMSLNRPEPPTIGSVSTLLAMDRTLKPLERRGLMTVKVDIADKRSRRLVLTAAGRKLLAVAVPIWQSTHAAIEDALPGADPDALRAELHALSGPGLSRPHPVPGRARLCLADPPYPSPPVGEREG
jgi:DNA-binding MarR family transcriptional regulator